MMRRLAASIAMALRAFCRFNDLRYAAEFRGAEFPEFDPILTQLEARERYKRAVGDWLWETPATAAAVLALVEFAGYIAGDKLLSEGTRDSGPVSDETDAFHQVIALAAAGAWINTTVLAEWGERLRQQKAAARDGTTE